MRKKLFKPLSLALATAMLFSVSCQDALETNYVPASDNAKTGTIKRSAEDAIEWALSFKNGQPGNQSRSGASADIKDVKVITSNASRSDADTLIYAINYANNAGYALVSASCATEPVLGYVEEGSFDEERVTDNPSYSYFLNEAKRYAASPLGMGDLYPTKPIDKITYVNDSIPPRLEVKWNQHYPEGYFFDNKISGCVQTATAQIMSYLEQPTSITLTYPGRDKNTQAIDWHRLKEHKKSSYGISMDCSLNHDEHLVLARLCRQIGYLNGAVSIYVKDDSGNITGSETGVAAGNITKAFKVLLPNNIVTSLSFDGLKLYETLGGNRIAMIAGSVVKNNEITSAGHVWVCDGGRRIGYLNTFTLIDGTKESFSGDIYLHYDWGKGGMDNGYFLSTVFTPSEGKEYDTQVKGYTETNYGGNPWYIVLKK